MKDRISAMVDRFLGWKLPKTFGPDCGIKFTPSNGMTREEAYDKVGWWPIGTNLFTATEARAMLEHILPPMPKNVYSTEAEGDAYAHGWFDGNEAPPYGKPHIAEHLFIEQRGDGKWLVCVEKVHDRMEQAQAACRAWIEATGGVRAVHPSPTIQGVIDGMTTLIEQWHEGDNLKAPEMWMAAAAGALSGARALLQDAPQVAAGVRVHGEGKTNG